MPKPLSQLSMLTADERKALEWALWFATGHLRSEAKSFPWPAEDNIELLESVEHKLFHACSNIECKDGIDQHVNAPCTTCNREAALS